MCLFILRVIKIVAPVSLCVLAQPIHSSVRKLSSFFINVVLRHELVITFGAIVCCVVIVPVVLTPDIAIIYPLFAIDTLPLHIIDIVIWLHLTPLATFGAIKYPPLTTFFSIF